jgi:hypothetical protein
LRRHDGEYCWVFERASPLRNAAGVFSGYIGWYRPYTSTGTTIARPRSNGANMPRGSAAKASARPSVTASRWLS